MAAQTIVEGQTATNPATKKRIVYRKGKWYPVDQDPAGGQPAQGTLEPLTPGAESRTRLGLGLGPAVEAQKQFYRSEEWKPGTANPQGINPFTRDWGARMAEAIPFDNGVAARVIGGQDYQDYEQASKTFESAFLPILSGAAVTPTEAQRMIRANLPQMGDTPQTLAKKARNRAMMINAAADLLGKPRPFPRVGIMNLGGAPEAGSAPDTPNKPVAQGDGWKVLSVE